MATARRPIFALTLALLPALAGGCKVVSIEDDRARRALRAEAGDPAAFVGARWASKIVPTLQERSVPLPSLAAARAKNLDAVGTAQGRKAGEGSPWTFTVTGTGVVTNVDRTSQRGLLAIAADADGGAVPVTVQIGPFVSGTAIRDALPFLPFNDFKDQLDYANIGNALTARAWPTTGKHWRSFGQGIRSNSSRSPTCARRMSRSC